MSGHHPNSFPHKQSMLDRQDDHKHKRLEVIIQGLIIVAGVVIMGIVIWQMNVSSVKPMAVSLPSKVITLAPIVSSSVSNKPQIKKGGESKGPVKIHISGIQLTRPQ